MLDILIRVSGVGVIFPDDAPVVVDSSHNPDPNESVPAILFGHVRLPC